MINPFTEVNWNPGIAERRKFGRTLLLGFPILAMVMAVLKWFVSGKWHWEAALWMAGVGVAVGLIALALPTVAKPLYLVWYSIACSIGLVMSNLLLGAFYYFAVAPVGLLKRALSRRTFHKGFQKSAETYWQDARQISDPERYYNQF